MAKYGAYQADAPSGELVWFQTGEAMQTGAYIRGHGSKPNVYIADSVAALIMRIAPNIAAMEQTAQNALAPADSDQRTRQEMAATLSDELIERLSRDDSLWVENPHWICHLRWAAE